MMVTNPEDYVEPLRAAGAGMFTFHVEATSDAAGLADKARAAGMRAGVALKPGTPGEAVHALCDADKVDMVLVMTVEPGFGGQKFQPEMMPKVKALRERYPNIDIQVGDGAETIPPPPVARLFTPTLGTRRKREGRLRPPDPVLFQSPFHRHRRVPRDDAGASGDELASSVARVMPSVGETLSRGGRRPRPVDDRRGGGGGGECHRGGEQRLRLVGRRSGHRHPPRRRRERQQVSERASEAVAAATYPRMTRKD